MKAPPKDLMNTMQRAILTLFCYDDKPMRGLENVLRQCLQLTANMPVLAIYAYQAWRYSQGESLFIHVPEARALHGGELLADAAGGPGATRSWRLGVLDVALVLHADHGGGNNSTFTNHVVTSSGTDTYSAIAASMAS